MVKNTLLVHGTWLVAAITSFVAGSQFFPADGGREDARVGSETRARALGGKSAGPSEASGGSRSGARPGVGAHPGSGTGNQSRVVLSGEDITSLGEQLRASASPIERRLAFSRLLEGLTAENALQIREQIAHMPQHSPEFREFHYAWGAVAGTEAIMFGVDTEQDDMSPALAGWASANPTAALAWFEGLDMENDARFDPLFKGRKLSPDMLRGHLMRGLVQGMADRDANQAGEFVLGLAAAGRKEAEGLMHIVAGAVLRTSTPAEAAEWAEGLPEGQVRNSMFGRMAYHFVESDLKGALEWASTYRDRPEGTQVIRAIATTWAQREPEKAVDWLQTLPASEGRSQAFRAAFGAWAGRDPAEAGEYIVEEMSPSPERDSAISGFANRVVHEDPATGVKWAASINDPQAREDALVRTGQVYYRRDARGAQEWLATSGLSPEAQQLVLTPPNSNPWRQEDK